MRYEKPEMDIVEFIENVYMELSTQDKPTEDNGGFGEGIEG